MLADIFLSIKEDDEAMRKIEGLERSYDRLYASWLENKDPDDPREFINPDFVALVTSHIPEPFNRSGFVAGTTTAIRDLNRGCDINDFDGFTAVKEPS
ncbi:MAG: hypothetical protein AAF414_19580 [Pseudomonadota bacterium]